MEFVKIFGNINYMNYTILDNIDLKLTKIVDSLTKIVELQEKIADNSTYKGLGNPWRQYNTIDCVGKEYNYPVTDPNFTNNDIGLPVATIRQTVAIPSDVINNKNT
jgi:hypothetical protein